MLTNQQLKEKVTDLFDKIIFTSEPSGLYDPLRYMISIGGKRLRPMLCLLTYSLYKDNFDRGILEPAAGLEVFHSFTLIHDDIMDHSPLRRGVPTVWKKWDEDTAILSGDVMCIDSYKRVAKAPAAVLDKVLELFSKTAAEVCDGQQYDMEFENRKDVTMDEYMQMIGLKTGVLIACAAKMGALIGGASEEDCENLYQWAYNMGLAFQVADDFLDAYGDEKVFGKPIGGDINNNKKCWLTIHAMEKADTETAARLSAALDMESGEAKIAAVKELYNLLGVGADAESEIERLTAKAMDYAAKVCSGEELEALREFAYRLVKRNK